MWLVCVFLPSYLWRSAPQQWEKTTQLITIVAAEFTVKLRRISSCRWARSDHFFEVRTAVLELVAVATGSKEFVMEGYRLLVSAEFLHIHLDFYQEKTCTRKEFRLFQLKTIDGNSIRFEAFKKCLIQRNALDWLGGNVSSHIVCFIPIVNFCWFLC